MYFRSVRRGFSKASESVIAGLDIGASKVCCAIAKIEASGELRVAGIGYHGSRGIKGGTIIDMEALQSAVAQAVHMAEDAADVTLSELYVAISPAICASKTVKVELPVAGHPVDETDIKKIVQLAIGSVHSEALMGIHNIPLSYEIDGITGVRDPRGMFGDMLRSKIHMIFANKTPLRNITACVERAHLDVLGFVASVYASGLSTLVEDELDLGVTLLDMGAGSTSIGIFYGGKLGYVDQIPIGGAHVTSDIARCFSTPLNQAERLKTLHGSAMISPTGMREMIQVPQIGDESGSKGVQISKGELTQVIRPRIEEIFETVRVKLASHPMYKIAGRRMVLTGGASLMPGMVEMAGMILDKQGRLGKPLHLQGMTEGARIPSFASTAGLLIYGQRQRGPVTFAPPRKESLRNPLGRVGEWFRENI